MAFLILFALLTFIAVAVTQSQYRRLAFDFNKEPKKFGYIGVAILYGTSFLCLLILFLFDSKSASLADLAIVSLIFFPGILVGIIPASVYYSYMKNSWTKEDSYSDMIGR